MLSQVIKYMVEPSEGGVFIGFPRAHMEKIGVSNGKLYKQLYDTGFERVGRGKSAKRYIPPTYIK